MTVGELKKHLEQFENGLKIRMTLEASFGQIEDNLAEVFLIKNHDGQGKVIVMLLGEAFD